LFLNENQIMCNKNGWNQALSSCWDVRNDGHILTISIIVGMDCFIIYGLRNDDVRWSALFPFGNPNFVAIEDKFRRPTVNELSDSPHSFIRKTNEELVGNAPFVRHFSLDRLVDVVSRAWIDPSLRGRDIVMSHHVFSNVSVYHGGMFFCILLHRNQDVSLDIFTQWWMTSVRLRQL
jgi:hypothetical protein